MTIYKIITAQTVYEVALVEADSKEGAEEIVLNDTGELQWDYLSSDGWEIIETKLQQ